MTINDEVTAAMGVSEPYCTNYQTLVYPADRAADFEGLTSLEGLSIAVESGSAGEDAAEELGATTVPVQSQANTLMEVASGTSDAAVSTCSWPRDDRRGHQLRRSGVRP